MFATTVLGISFISLAAAHGIPFFSFQNTDPDLMNYGSFGIINGTETVIKKHPYQAAIYFYDTFVQSGAIIDKKWILTSPIPPTVSSSITVRVGSTKLSEMGKDLKVEKIVLHPDFTAGTNHSLSLVKLTSPLKFSKYIRKITIASETPQNQSTAVLTGWGSTDETSFLPSNVLREDNLSILDKETCKSAYIASLISQTTFCGFNSNGVYPYLSDEGDPLVQKKKLVGIFIRFTGYSTVCIDANYCPAVFSDVAKLESWIKLVIQNE
ncbi:trypsin-7-like [Lycorma delicatula]|uniref:trypsin-7-like n=1 Tax=Lycorma delicatula TaxID=130591 RepID=UPI003F516FDB